MKGRCKKMSLIENYDIQKIISSSPDKCTRNNKKKKGTSFCTCQNASLTVEAAMILPLTTGFLISILFFFRVLFVQEAVEEALIYAGRVVAVESCLTDTEEVLFLSAEGLLKYALLKDKNVENYVSGGVLGVSLLGSQFSGKEIELQANYMVKFPIAFFGWQGIWLRSENCFVKWKGDLYSETTQETWVYITETGSVYHKHTNCRSLDLHIQEGKLTEMSLYRGKNGQKYSPCNKCMKDIHVDQRVYFTDYGSLYHGKLSCSALKRTITRVLISQVEGRRACSFCY